MEDNLVEDQDLDLIEDVDIDNDPDLEGLGRRYYGRKPSRRAKRYARRYSNRRVRSALNRRNMTRGQSHLVTKSHGFSQETRNKLKSGTLQYGDGIYYIRRKITGSGIIELFDDTIDRKVGITNLSKGKLSDHVNLALERVELNYAHESTDIGAGKASYEPISITDDASLRNAEMEVMAAGKSIFKLPVNKFCDEQKDIRSKANGYNLEALKMIKEGNDIQIRLHLGETLAADATDFHYVEVSLRGAETKPR